MQSTSFVDNLRKVKSIQADNNVKQSLQIHEFNFKSVKPKPAPPPTQNDAFDAEAISETDPFFPRIRLVNRYCSHDELKALIPPYTETLTITDLYKQVSPPEFKRPPDAAPNFAVFGIVATRSVSRVSARGNKFVTITLSDLKYDISLALHGKAHDKYWKVRPGTLIAMFNPQFYVQKYEHTARSLALSISKDTCLIEIGQAKDLGQCEAMTSASQHSKRCKNWVDVRKTRVCDFHIEQKATKSKRPEFNASSAKLWDPRGGSSSRNGGAESGKRLTVYEGGEVAWKRGLQVDSQAGFGRQSNTQKKSFSGGFADAPIGRVFQTSDNDYFNRRKDPKKYEESVQDKLKKKALDKRQLERITDDAKLKSQLINAPPRVTKPSTQIKGAGFARSQLRKLGFNPLSLGKATQDTLAQAPRASIPASKASTSSGNTTQGYPDSDSELEII